jgi:drug/metabolite transporter (DMT)-like permease
MPALRLAGAQLAIGAAAIFARYALLGAGPVAVSALRLALAAFAAIMFARAFARISLRREVAFACAGFALAVHFATWIGSLLYTSVALSTLLVTTTPVWTELFDVVRERRPPARAYLVALACAVAGVATIAFARPAVPAPIPGSAPLGDALALAGGLALGVYLVIVRDAGANTTAAFRVNGNGERDGDGRTQRLGTGQIVARTYAWAALGLIVASAVLHQGPPALGDRNAWAGILAMAFVSQLLGHTALNAALRDFTPSIVALSTLLEPVVAAVLAAVFLHESVSQQAALGAVLVLAAVGFTLGTTPRVPTAT